jgi:CO/xanthine dehydrogenase Mo-binding subunit
MAAQVVKRPVKLVLSRRQMFTSNGYMSTPTWMRAPGECTAIFALETAMDELAYELKIDPVELRLKNYPARDLEKNQDWSSNSLRECLSQGANLFGLGPAKIQTRFNARGQTIWSAGALRARLTRPIVAQRAPWQPFTRTARRSCVRERPILASELTPP